MSGESPIGEIKFRIRHTMLPVSDLDRTIDFYTRLFGMDIMRMRERPGERVGYLGYGSEDDGPALELIQSGAPGGHVRMAPWAGHVAIFVSDLHKLCETLRREGVKFIREAQAVRPGSPDLVAFIQDPDGYTLELTERHSRTGPPLKENK
ncbi:MAG: VOC family protein [Deltaproteobacteria bacterium]|nr:VOC family protein [Deltaproteobacteria bacterium]MBI2211464.1 VOC family protein [Deltaproteobacteria bacterium]MBI3061057.1 VOC family protein [Deltaproteobacteria bacterium]